MVKLYGRTRISTEIIENYNKRSEEFDSFSVVDEKCSDFQEYQEGSRHRVNEKEKL